MVGSKIIGTFYTNEQRRTCKTIRHALAKSSIIQEHITLIKTFICVRPYTRSLMIGDINIKETPLIVKEVGEACRRKRF